MNIQMDKDLRYVFEVLPSFGTRYSNLVMAYCQLFGVTPFQIKTKKLRLILEEMKRLFDAQAFTFQKKLYPISHKGIAEALDLCIKKNFTQHLENHNYLKKVMIGISEREGKNQSRAAEKNLKSREQQLLAGGGRQEDAGPEEAGNHTPVEDLPEDVRKGIADLKERLGMNKISKKTEEKK